MIFNWRSLHQMSTSEQSLYIRICRLMNELSAHNKRLSRPDRLDYNCHSISRALAMIETSLQLENGFYFGLTPTVTENGKCLKTSYKRHSWLRTGRGSIIDTHPVAIVAVLPLFVVGRGSDSSFGAGPYVRDERLAPAIFTRKVDARTTRLVAFFEGLTMKT